MQGYLEVKNLDKAETMLRGIPNGIERAVSGAINKTLKNVKTEIKFKTSKEYNISSSDVGRDLKTTKSNFSTLRGTINARYYEEPLIRFLSSQSKDKTRVKIKRNDKSKVLQGKKEYPGKPFVQILENGHIGIFQRSSNQRRVISEGKNKGKKHTPIKQLYTLAISKMIGAESVSSYVLERGEEYLEKNLEKEVNRILMGYL